MSDLTDSKYDELAPLTPDELKQMEGQPVWVVMPLSGYEGWAMVNTFSVAGGKNIVYAKGTIKSWGQEDYALNKRGDNKRMNKWSWLAYRIPQAKWIQSDKSQKYICSKCVRVHPIITQYCPHCGVYMTNYEQTRITK